jgi:hypothetical protein
MTDENDSLFRRAAESLRAPGALDAEAMSAVIAAVRRASEHGAGSPTRAERGTVRVVSRGGALLSRGSRRFLAGLAAGLAFAVGLGLGLFAGWRMRGASDRLAAEDMASRQRVALSASPVTPGAALALEPVQFMFVAPSASHVALVGEFNDWDATATPMARADGGTWHVALPLARGRYVYAFVVDGRTWVADPQAPLAPERWFGARNSVLLVNDRRLQ